MSSTNQAENLELSRENSENYELANLGYVPTELHYSETETLPSEQLPSENVDSKDPDLPERNSCIRIRDVSFDEELKPTDSVVEVDEKVDDKQGSENLLGQRVLLLTVMMLTGFALVALFVSLNKGWYYLKGDQKKHANWLFLGEIIQPNLPKFAYNLDRGRRVRIRSPILTSHTKCPKIAIKIFKKYQKSLRPIF